MSGASRPPRRRPQAGFTLLEMLIAFTIAALALAVVLPAFSTGLRSLDVAGADVAAMMAARSLIDRVGADLPLEDADLSDSADGVRWELHIRRQLASPAERLAGGEAPAVVPVEVEVTAVSGDGPAVTLRTLRLAPLR